jgi:hypothetical protein
MPTTSDSPLAVEAGEKLDRSSDLVRRVWEKDASRIEVLGGRYFQSACPEYIFYNIKLTPEVVILGVVYRGVGKRSIIGQNSFQGAALVKTDLDQGSLIPIN